MLPVAGDLEMLPDAEGVFDAIARIGYQFEHAIADLVDNSIDAGATRVTIRFAHDGKKVVSMMVLDNGAGMTDAAIDLAMTFGAKTHRDGTRLGKYGMGLKSASFSQCQVLTVVSRSNRKTSGRRWTAAKARAGWQCEVLDRAPARDYLDAQVGHLYGLDHGTLVEWGNLDALSHAMDRPSKVIEHRFNQLRLHLGLTFHRFLEKGTVEIVLSSTNLVSGASGFDEPVTPLNPFPRVPGRKGYPLTFTFSLPDGPELTFQAHIWRRDAVEAGYRLGGKAASKQGIYAYRNDRMIQAGGWNGIRNDAEVHTSLARVCLDLPASLDAEFKPTVQKSAVSMPEVVLSAIRAARSGRTSFADYLADAEASYREQKPNRRRRLGLVPTSGLNKPIITLAEALLGPAEGPEDSVSIRWDKLDDSEFFRVDSDSGEILLNSTFRDAVLYGTRASGGDAPVVKTLLLLLLKDEMARKQKRGDHEIDLMKMSLLLAQAAESQR